MKGTDFISRWAPTIGQARGRGAEFSFVADVAGLVKDALDLGETAGRAAAGQEMHLGRRKAELQVLAAARAFDELAHTTSVDKDAWKAIASRLCKAVKGLEEASA